MVLFVSCPPDVKHQEDVLSPYEKIRLQADFLVVSVGLLCFRSETT